jgi:hypothetical protein
MHQPSDKQLDSEHAQANARLKQPGPRIDNSLKTPNWDQVIRLPHMKIGQQLAGRCNGSNQNEIDRPNELVCAQWTLKQTVRPSDAAQPPPK